MTCVIEAVHPVLMSTDVPASTRFYQRLGFTTRFLDSETEPRYAAVERDGVELHLQWADASQWAGSGDRPVFRFLVSDVDALFQEFMSAGMLRTERGRESPWAVPGDTPWGTREFHLHDPDRNGLQFYRAL